MCHIQDGKGSEENVRRWLCRDDADHEDKLLACAAIIVAQLRIQVMEETQFTCSAGIAHNKVAKDVILLVAISYSLTLGLPLMYRAIGFMISFSRL